VDVLALEKVQRSFIRLILGMAELAHEKRLIRLALYSLEFNKMRGESHRNLYISDRTRCMMYVSDCSCVHNQWSQSTGVNVPGLRFREIDSPRQL